MGARNGGTTGRDNDIRQKYGRRKEIKVRKGKGKGEINGGNCLSVKAKNEGRGTRLMIRRANMVRKRIRETWHRI
jgi:hypothetical protein